MLTFRESVSEKLTGDVGSSVVEWSQQTNKALGFDKNSIFSNKELFYPEVKRCCG